MSTQDTRYSAEIFLRSVLPLFAVLAKELPEGRSLLTRQGVIQFRTRDSAEDMATHFLLDGSDIQTVLGKHESPDLELFFPTPEHFVAFFKGRSKKLPKIKGWRKFGLLIPTLRTLLKMSSILGARTCPGDEATQLLLIKCMFFLLPSGISTLNKLGHPEVRKWSETSPDRVYAWTLDGHEEIASYIRVKGGNTKACRGLYRRSQPFYTMRFADPVSALGVLQQTADMLQLTAEHKLIMEGAPEFGAKIGDLMMLVAKYAQA